MIKLVIVSDTHGLTPALPDGDILIHCGDLTPFGTLRQLALFINWFGSQPHPYKICIAGNHDFILQETNCKYMFDHRNIIYLEDQLALVKGLRIYGSPWTPTYRQWAFMKDRGLPIANMWANIPDNLDILITHGPPMGIMDYSIYSHKSVGCNDLYLKVKQARPRLHCFGHIHSGHGIKVEDGITFINAAVVSERYELTYDPMEVDV